MKINKLLFVCLIAIVHFLPAECLAQPNIQLDSFAYVQYGKQKLYLDRITKTEAGDTANKPVFIFLYGGGWESGDRKNNGLSPFFEELLLKGYIVVAIDYRLGIKEAKEKREMNATNGVQMYLRAIDMAVEDLYAATSFILTHAKEWKIDPKQIVIAGGSAGATTSIVAEYGVCNNSANAQKYLPAGFNYAGVISMAGALWIQGDTTKSVWNKKPCPFLFFIGNQDQLVTYNESHTSGFAGYGAAYLSKQFTEMGVANWFYDYVDGDHIIAGTPVINRREEIYIFLNRFVREKSDLYLHTIEKSKIPTNILQFISIEEEDDQ